MPYNWTIQTAKGLKKKYGIEEVAESLNTCGKRRQVRGVVIIRQNTISPEEWPI